MDVKRVNEFKLLGCTIDDSLSLKNLVDNLKSQVLKKVFAIKNIFYLPFTTRLQFLKTFILPHFDYCSSLFIFMTKALIHRIARLYNFAIFIILKIKLSFLNEIEQYNLLKPFNLLPYRIRLFYRFSIFSYKILNQTLLKPFYSKLSFKNNIKSLRNSTLKILEEPFCRTTCGQKRISYFLPKFTNIVIKFSFNLNNLEFKKFLNNNLILLFEKFNSLI